MTLTGKRTGHPYDRTALLSPDDMAWRMARFHGGVEKAIAKHDKFPASQSVEGRDRHEAVGQALRDLKENRAMNTTQTKGEVN